MRGLCGQLLVATTFRRGARVGVVIRAWLLVVAIGGGIISIGGGGGAVGGVSRGGWRTTWVGVVVTG